MEPRVAGAVGETRLRARTRQSDPTLAEAGAGQVVGIRVGDVALRARITPRGVAGLRLGGGPEPTALTGLAATLAGELAEYFGRRLTRFSVPADLSVCSEFQRRVLDACARIPAGTTTTYARLAREVGCPGAARAVGTALARNPVLILVPCHRVLRAGGGLGGFIAGLEWKRRLLEIEGVTVS